MHVLLVEVGDDGGDTGVGCLRRHRRTGLLAAAVREVLAPVLLWDDPEEAPELWQQMYQESGRGARRVSRQMQVQVGGGAQGRSAARALRRGYRP